MRDLAICSAAACRINLPLRSCGRNQHGARSGARLAQLVPEGADGLMTVVAVPLGIEPGRPHGIGDDGVLGIDLDPVLEDAGADRGVRPLGGTSGRMIAVRCVPDDVRRELELVSGGVGHTQRLPQN